MLIFNSRDNIENISSLSAELSDDYMWILDLEMLDFTLSPVELLMEIECPIITLKFNNLVFDLPTNWFMLIYDEETTMLDVVKVSDMVGKGHTAFVYGNYETRVTSTPLTVIDYSPRKVVALPSLTKKQMLCHPISDSKWICIGITDVFAKTVKDLSVGDFT
jgi:hypothetical protein